MEMSAEEYDTLVIDGIRAARQVARGAVAWAESKGALTARETEAIAWAADDGFGKALQWARLHGYIKIIEAPGGLDGPESDLLAD